MTSLLVWFAADKKKMTEFQPASVYIATDSRFTWDDGTGDSWDFGKKVFACANHPDVFGYVGDTFFCISILSQIVSAIDAGYLFNETDNANEKMGKVQQLIRSSWKHYPKKQQKTFRIVHVTRQGSGTASRFWIQEHVFVEGEQKFAHEQPIQAPCGEYSQALCVRGTGKYSVFGSIESWNAKYSNRHTSRSLFAAFCASIRSGDDKFTGGPAQLVGLYRVGGGRTFGVIWDNSRYFEGLPTLMNANKSSVPWRNDSFEIVDSKDKKRRKGAAKQFSVFDFAEPNS